MPQPDPMLAEIIAQLEARLAEKDQQIADKDQQLSRKDQAPAQRFLNSPWLKSGFEGARL